MCVASAMDHAEEIYPGNNLDKVPHSLFSMAMHVEKLTNIESVVGKTII